MGHKYRIILGKGGNFDSAVRLHPEVISKQGKQEFESVNIQFGIRTCRAKVIPDTSLSQQEVALSRKVVRSLRIPLNGKYELIYTDNRIIFGPYIGILVSARKERLRQKKETLLSFVHDYEKINGAIVAFTSDAIDEKHDVVHGLYYNPDRKRWEKGEYPLPSAMFKQLSINSRTNRYFVSRIGKNVFNTPTFDKWQMYKWLRSSPVSVHLPDTLLYKNPKSVLSFLKRHRSVYLKPTSNSFGNGIMKVTRGREGIVVRDQNAERGRDKRRFRSNRAFLSFLRRRIRRENYIIQQGIDLLSWRGRIVDFRCLILKNQRGEWEEAGFISRYGKLNRIVSNILSGGEAEKGEMTLKKVLRISDEGAAELRAQMHRIAIDAATKIEEFGIHCGNLGIDMAIDVDGHIWIIEMNNHNPDHTIALDANDKQMYYRARLMNMLYAKYLAGFPERDEPRA